MGRTKVLTESPGAIQQMLIETGRVPDPVIAAGQLRQGKAPTMGQMITGVALIEVLRPRRFKKLPRHFVMAVTEDEIYVFKCVGGTDGDDAGDPYWARVSDKLYTKLSRADVKITELPKGEKSDGGVMHVGGESFPISRPNLSGDPNTDELIALLAA